MTNKAAEAAKEYCQLYYHKADGTKVSAGPNPTKEVYFLAGAKWMLEQAELWCSAESLSGCENPRYQGESPAFQLVEQLKQLIGE